MFMVCIGSLHLWILLAWNALGPRYLVAVTVQVMVIGEGLQVEDINVSYSWHCDLRNQHILQ
jgi:hypothetical protein